MIKRVMTTFNWTFPFKPKSMGNVEFQDQSRFLTLAIERILFEVEISSIYECSGILI